jgi:hypothetical protein
MAGGCLWKERAERDLEIEDQGGAEIDASGFFLCLITVNPYIDMIGYYGCKIHSTILKQKRMYFKIFSFDALPTKEILIFSL